MFNLDRKNSIFSGSLLLGLSLILSFFQKKSLMSNVSLSPGEAIASKMSSLPTTSFFLLILAAAAIVLLGAVGIIFLIVGLREK